MEQVNKYLFYLSIIILLFLTLFLSIKIADNILNANKIMYEKASKYVNMEVKSEETQNDIKYPKFNIKTLDEAVNDFVEKYKSKNNVNIEYTVYVSKTLVNMFFKVKDNDVISYTDINYSINSKTFETKEVFDFNLLGEEVLNKAKIKYSTEIYTKILENNFKDTHIKVQDEGIYVYYNQSLFNDLPYEVFVFFESDETKSVAETPYDKIIAFTFDDGPGSYSEELARTLLSHESKATFFELGNRMKYNQDTVKTLYGYGMEIGSHTYAHKNLNKLSDEEIDEEINSVNILFNEITGDNIKLLRPPYGNANSNVKSRVNMPIILWNVDTEDWLSRNSEQICNHILEHASDGDIILMHDIYGTTLEAVKMALPILKSRGFKVTTVSELASIKGVNLENGVSYRHFE